MLTESLCEECGTPLTPDSGTRFCPKCLLGLGLETADDPLIGATISRYKVLAHLGGGGMGVVYRGQDTLLRRHVAIKVLPEGHFGELQIRRFQREARASSALNHPHICTVYDIGEYDGQPFIVMELMEGETLKVAGSGQPARADDVVRLGCQIADALEAAHSQNIIHRDIKPANIFMTKRGDAKLLDFGLAKQVPEPQEMEATASDLTGEGTTLGTIAYMSPEQARGESLDIRSDIFSLGVVLYEMLAGCHPFRRETLVATGAAILNDPPLRLDSNVADRVSEAVERMLEKSPSNRYQTPAEVRAVLEGRKPALSRTPPRRRSIAVLPFVNLSIEPENDYLCDGMAEELINALTRIEGLRVAARTSSFQFRGQSRDIRQIAEALGVENVLEGSIRRSGNRLRVTAQLIKASDGCHLWSGRYDREMEDIFDFEDEMTATIIEALKVRFSARPTASPSHTRNVQAYHLYLKGRFFWNNRHAGGLLKAIECFEAAIAADPEYARAYTGLTDAYLVLGLYDFMPPEVVYDKARTAHEKAVVLAPDLPEILCSSAWRKFFFEWAPRDGIDDARRAVKLDPRSVQARCWHGLMAAFLGRDDEAMSALRVAVELDPLSSYAYAILAYVHQSASRDEEVIETAQQALELDPHSVLAHYVKGGAAVRRGLYEEGIRCMETAAQLSARAPFYVGLVAWACSEAGLTKRVDELQTELNKRAQTEFVGHQTQTSMAIARGDLDTVFSLLDQLHETHGGFIMGQHGSPFWDKLRTDPRWPAVLQRIGF